MSEQTANNDIFPNHRESGFPGSDSDDVFPSLHPRRQSVRGIRGFKNKDKNSSYSPSKIVAIALISVLILVILGGGWYFLAQRTTEQGVEKKIEETNNGKVSEEREKTTTKIEEEKSTTSKTEIPSNFPSDLTVYKEAEITEAKETETASSLTLKTTDSVKKVVEFYRSDLSKNVWEMLSSSTINDSSLITAEKGNKSVLIIVAKDNGKTGIIINVKIGK